MSTRRTHKIRTALGLAVASGLALTMAWPASVGAAPVPIDPVCCRAADYTGDKATLIGDVNGDKRADVVAVHSNGPVTVSLARTPNRAAPTMTYTLPAVWTDIPFYGDRGTFLADVDGDSKSDLIVVNNNGVVVRKSTGKAFAANEQWAGAYYGSIGTWFADVTGDKKADAIVVNHTGAYGAEMVVRRSTGSGFAANESWGVGGDWAYTPDTKFGDANGDGRADLLYQEMYAPSKDSNPGAMYSEGSKLAAYGVSFPCPGNTCTLSYDSYANIVGTAAVERIHREFEAGITWVDAAGKVGATYYGCSNWTQDGFGDWDADGDDDYLQVRPGGIALSKNTKGVFQLLSC